MRSKLCLTLIALIILEIGLGLAAVGRAQEDAPPKAPHLGDFPPKPPQTMGVAGTSPFFQPIVSNLPKPIVLMLMAYFAPMSYAIPQSAFSPRAVAEERRQTLLEYAGRRVGEPPPEIWSRLNITSSAYIYDSAWGRYVFPKMLPMSVLHHSYVDSGYCETPNPDPDAEKGCLSWHSNYSLNATMFVWLMLDGVLMTPISMSVIKADETTFKAYAVGVRGSSQYYVSATFNFTHVGAGPKITLEAGHLSGTPRNFRIVVAGFTSAQFFELSGVGVDINSYRNVEAFIGARRDVRWGFDSSTSDSWSRLMIVDWGDEGFADVYVGSFTVLGRSFLGWMARFQENDSLIDPTIYAFDNGVVNINTGSTGEQTIATINTNLPSGDNAIVVIGHHGSIGAGIGSVRLRLKRGTTVLSQQEQAWDLPDSTAGNRSRGDFLVYRDVGAPSNPTYTVVLNVENTASTTLPYEVKVIIINGVQSAFVDGSATTINASATATIATLSTTLPSANYVVVAAVQWWRSSGSGNAFLGANNIKLKKETTVVASNQFDVGSYWSIESHSGLLPYYDASSGSNPSYSVEITNGSSVAFVAEAKILVFGVGGGWFLDTGSVALSTSEVTVANLSTTLPANAEAGVIAALQVENTGSTDVVAVNASNAKLQINNSTTGQQVNNIEIYTQMTGYPGRAPFIGFATKYTSSGNDSFQVKVTATGTGFNAEVKMVVFILSTTQSYIATLSETVSMVDGLTRLGMFSRQVSESSNLVDSLAAQRVLTRIISEAVSMVDSVTRFGVFIRYVSGSLVMSDTLTRTGLLVRIMSESMTMSDTLTRLGVFMRGVLDGVTMSDNAGITNKIIRNILDTVSQSDSLSRQLLLIRGMLESIASSDSPAAKLPFNFIFEAITMSDIINIIPPPSPPIGGGTSTQPPFIVGQPPANVGLVMVLATVMLGGLVIVSERRRRRRPMGEVWRRVRANRAKPASIKRFRWRRLRGVRKTKPHGERFGE